MFGITVRNSIMLISHLERLVQEEGMTWSLDTVLCGASGRLAPILMRALVTGFGLLPLALVIFPYANLSAVDGDEVVSAHLSR